jgi:hypothetical protein
MEVYIISKFKLQEIIYFSYINQVLEHKYLKKLKMGFVDQLY